jgi:lysophospholipase L1-like esterase
MDEILQLNEMIRNHCRGKRLRLVDAYPEFADNNDHLRTEFSAGDGGHLNAKGYKHLGQFIATSLADILKPGAKVACLGDSITEGYPGHFNGQEETKQWEPYTHYLIKPGVKVMNFGLSGDTTEGMTKRFYRDVLRTEFTICIIMGGVNDLFGGIPSREVMEALSALYADSERHQMVPVAVTVLPID